MQEVKLDEIISKLKKYPNLFRLREQENKNVSQYFSTFNQKYLPNNFIEIYSSILILSKSRKESYFSNILGVLKFI